MVTSQPHIRDMRTPEERSRDFLPGMGATWLLPLYDAFSALSGLRGVHARAARVAGVTGGQSVLDVGCGTANLAFALLRTTPAARVTGLDPDGAALRRAGRKARRRRVALELIQGYADRLPGVDGSVDHVVSSLALHHLDADSRAAFAAEALRILRPGGRVTIVDFAGAGPGGQPPSPDRAHDHGHRYRHGPHRLPGASGLIALLRLVGRLTVPSAGHSGPTPETDVSGSDSIRALLAGAGFAEARETARVTHRLGEMTIVQGTRPPA